MNDDTKGTGSGVLSILGDVLYWLSCILAAPIAAMSAVALIIWVLSLIKGHALSNPAWLGVLGLFVAFLVWLIGRAVRYILSGK